MKRTFEIAGKDLRDFLQNDTQNVKFFPYKLKSCAFFIFLILMITCNFITIVDKLNNHSILLYKRNIKNVPYIVHIIMLIVFVILLVKSTPIFLRTIACHKSILSISGSHVEIMGNAVKITDLSLMRFTKMSDQEVIEIYDNKGSVKAIQLDLISPSVLYIFQKHFYSIIKNI